MLLRKKISEEKIMKIFTSTLFALVLSTPLVLADGCNKHGEDVAMSCAKDQTWDAGSKQCIDTNA